MRHFPKSLCLGLIVILSLPFTFIYKYEATEEKLPPSFSLTIVRDKAIVGDKIVWHLYINIPDEQSIDNLQLKSGDSQGWQITDYQHPPQALTQTYVHDIKAIPLIEGELLPVLKATYNYAGEKRQTLIISDTPISIEPVHEIIKIDTTVDQRTVNIEDALLVKVRITNRSPFTLTNIQIQGKGVDLRWLSSRSINQLPAHKEIPLELEAVVEGQNPYPKLEVQYKWYDSSKIISTHTEEVIGEKIIVKDNILGQIPDELLGVVIGVITGALSTFITGLIAQALKERAEQTNNEQRTAGLLRLMVMQGDYAIKSSTKIDSEPLLKLFEEKGLFAILEKHNIVETVEKFWEASIHHNNYLNSPSGSQRAQRLKKSTKDLHNKIRAAFD